MTTKNLILFKIFILWFCFPSYLTSQTAVCKTTITKNTNATDCFVSLTFEDIDNGSYNFDSYTLSQSEFEGPDTFSVTLTLIKNNGQTANCTSTLYVLDKTKPVPYFRNVVNLIIDTSNVLFLTDDMFDLGSYDNCTGISHMTIHPTSVSCNDITPINIQIRVYDHAGNWDFANITANLSNAANNTDILVCNDEFKIYVNEGDSLLITSYDLLEGRSYKCWDDYKVELFLNDNLTLKPNNIITINDINKRYLYKVTDGETGNKCWGLVSVKSGKCLHIVVCDTLPRCADFGDCTSGHTQNDDVEWPCNHIFTDVPESVLKNPTPWSLSTFSSLNFDEFVPIFYNGEEYCNHEIGMSYLDSYMNVGNGRLITRTWNIIHRPTSQTFSYNQKIILNAPDIDDCGVCDVMSWNTPVTDCGGGHSDTDAVEWPGDLYLNAKRFSPLDLSYDPDIHINDVLPALSETCASYYSMTYNDLIFKPRPDSLVVERTWTLVNIITSEFYSFVQKIYILNPIPVSSAMVCVRQRNGNALNDVTLYPGNIIESGPCKEFEIDPANTLVKPSKESSDYLAGVDLADLILLYEYIVGNRTLTPSQVRAGDFYGNNGLSTFDLVHLQRMINGEQLNLSNWPSPWKFMYEVLHPSFQNVRDHVILTANNSSQTGHHFIGYKLGDINDSYLESSLPTIPVDVYDEIITAGESYTIPVFSNNEIQAKGIQFRVHKNGKIKILDVKSSFFEKFEITEYDTYYSMIGYNQNYNSTNIAVDDIFLNITFQALQNSILSEALDLFDENYNKFILADTYAALPFDVTFENIISSNQNVDLNREINIYPNPANDKIFITGLEEDCQLEVWDVAGQRVTQNTLQSGLTMYISGLIPGVYILKAQLKDGHTFVNRFVKI